MPTALLVIAPEGFRDEEYAHPKEVLERRGVTVVTASVAPGPCRGKLGMTARADVALSEADTEDYDAVAFVGGPGASIFFDDEAAQRFAAAMDTAGKVVAAICIAPSTLARAGLLAERAATAFPDRADDLIAHGARFTGADVEIDGHIVTANGPAAARSFGDAIADLLEP
ncbi:MAG: DJ-1/PfpI family protein [Coriobacteriia bacterium]